MTEARRIFDPVLWLDNLRVVNKEGAFTAAEKDLIDDAISILQRELRKQHEQSDMVARGTAQGGLTSATAE